MHTDSTMLDSDVCVVVFVSSLKRPKQFLDAYCAPLRFYQQYLIGLVYSLNRQKGILWIRFVIRYPKREWNISYSYVVMVCYCFFWPCLKYRARTTLLLHLIFHGKNPAGNFLAMLTRLAWTQRSALRWVRKGLYTGDVVKCCQCLTWEYHLIWIISKDCDVLAMLSVIFFKRGEGAWIFTACLATVKKNVLLNRSKLSFTESTWHCWG